MKLIAAHKELPRLRDDHGVTIIEVIGRSAAIPFAKCSMAECIVDAGGTVAAHLHTYSDEIYLFTSGRGEMEINGKKVTVAAGTIVLLEPGDEHAARTIGSVPLCFWAITLPAFVAEDHILTRNRIRRPQKIKSQRSADNHK